MAAPDDNDSTSREPLARRWWLNLALLVVVAGLGLFAWYHSQQVPKDTRPRLTDLSPDAVQTVDIQRAGQPEVQLARRDGDWRLLAPITARADAFAVKSLLRLLHAPVESSITPKDSDLARYGLEPPKLTVRLNGGTIEFGERHPLKNEQYVKFGSAVRLISSQYYAQAAAPYTNLIDSRLIEAGRKLVSIKLPDFTLTLKDGAWVREPSIEALSSDRINAFVDEWQHARALQVEEHSGDEKVQETVVVGLTNPDGGSATLNIGVLAREPELILYRADEKLEYHFPKDTAQRLLVLKAQDKGQKPEPNKSGSRKTAG